ncbi:MAG: hypothetical protein GDA49_05230 [Rhodospirillales bacterium]|nr:hypothetical protein [Rhodospirillales bacterium]
MENLNYFHSFVAINSFMMLTVLWLLFSVVAWRAGKHLKDAILEHFGLLSLFCAVLVGSLYIYVFLSSGFPGLMQVMARFLSYR